MLGKSLHLRGVGKISFYTTFLACILFIQFTIAQSNPVTIPTMKIEMATYSDGNVNETFDQQSFNDYLETSLYNMVRNLSPQVITITEMNVMYVLDKGWRLMAQGVIDGNNLLFSRELLLVDDKLYWNETGDDEICLSACDNMQFVAPKDGGCTCLSGQGEPQYLMRNSAR